MERIAVYMRVSTKAQDFKSQKHAIEEYIQREKPNSKVIWFSEKMTGAEDNRPVFNAVLKELALREYDTFIIFKADRISRRALFMIKTFLEIDSYGVETISLKDPWLNLRDNPLKHTLRSAVAELSEMERDGIVARINAGVKSAMARGVKFGRPEKLKNASEHRRVIELREKGYSYRRIAKEMGVSLGKIHKMINAELNLIEQR